MTELDRAINTRLMEEFNLEPGARERIYDRETGELVTIKGKELSPPGVTPGKYATEFDPINSIRMMNHMFGTYVNMLQQQGVIEGDVISYGTMPSAVRGKVKAVMKVRPYDGDGGLTYITSKAYSNETSAYADLVCKINGEEVDMTPYDIDRQKQAEEQRKAREKEMKFNKKTKKKG